MVEKITYMPKANITPGMPWISEKAFGMGVWQ